MAPLVADYIETLQPYQAGRRVEEVARAYGLARVVKLASNESPLGPSPRGIEAARAALADSHRYPDPGAEELRAALAKRFRLRAANVVVGSGSEGILATAMRTFLGPDDEVITARNTFIGFRVLARACGRTAHYVPMRGYRYDLPAIADAISDRTKIVYLANPDNPTGSYATVAELEAFMARVPDHVIVVIDEAYWEFADGVADYPDSMRYRWDNAITLRTFSKAYGLAGLRIGYGFAHDEIVHNLLKVKLPFEPSTAAQAAGLAALDDETHLQATLAAVREGMPVLRRGLEALELQVLPSAANFVTVLLGSPAEADRIVEGLTRRGVIVRPLRGFGLPSAIRVSVGLAEENALLLAELGGLVAPAAAQGER